MPPYKDNSKERKFQTWYKLHAKKLGINEDPDDPLHFYDYRGAYDEGVEPEYMEDHKQFEWPDRFKIEGHPTKGMTPEEAGVVNEQQKKRRYK